MTPSTELPRDFCAGIGPLQLGVVLVSFISFQLHSIPCTFFCLNQYKIMLFIINTYYTLLLQSTHFSMFTIWLHTLLGFFFQPFPGSCTFSNLFCYMHFLSLSLTYLCFFLSNDNYFYFFSDWRSWGKFWWHFYQPDDWDWKSHSRVRPLTRFLIASCWLLLFFVFCYRKHKKIDRNILKSFSPPLEPWRSWNQLKCTYFHLYSWKKQL